MTKEQFQQQPVRITVRGHALRILYSKVCTWKDAHAFEREWTKHGINAQDIYGFGKTIPATAIAVIDIQKVP